MAGARPYSSKSISRDTTETSTINSATPLTKEPPLVVIGPRKARDRVLLTESLKNQDDILNAPAFFYIKANTSVIYYHKIIIQSVDSSINEGVSPIPTNKGPIYLVGKKPPTTVRISGTYLMGKNVETGEIITPKDFVKEYYNYLSAETSTKNNYDVYLSYFGDLIKVLVLGASFGNTYAPVLSVAFNLALLDESDVFKNLVTS